MIDADKFMIWYGRQGSANIAFAIVFAPVAVVLVIGKALWLVYKGDKRGMKGLKEAI